jgi:hypothetical protein
MAIQSRAAVFAALAAAVIGMGSARGQTPAPADRLVVHEWGTFTSVQGSDGVGLEGLQHEEERLPAFVYSRTKVRTCPLRNYGYKGLEVPVTSVTQKMETPVIYFHSKIPRTLDVRVDFVKGLLTQWYPVSDRLGPPEETVQHGPLDLKTIDRSFLSWKVELLPGGAAVSPAPPTVAADDPWAYARDVDAATVRTLPRERPERMGPVESERFLFYRGLGTFALPVAVESAPGGRAAVKNDGKLALPFAFALEITGDAGRFQPLGEIAAGSRRSFDWSDRKLSPKDSVVDGLKAAVAEALVASGLYRDEAAAMVKTWSRVWFGSEGTRIIYSVPRAEVDALLPLVITPAPDEVVRVLVGRIEFLTPETEAIVETALRQRLADDAPTRDAAMARLVRFDRFLEPHVRRVLSTTADPSVRKSGEEVLAQLRN